MADVMNNMRAAGFMTFSMAGFACNDALIKTLAGEVPLFQVIFLRGLVASSVLIAVAFLRGAAPRFPDASKRGALSLRCIGEIGCTFFFLTALFNMPISSATAILQSTPLAVTLGAALFLGEPVGWRRYLAIAIGFVGVLIIIRPGTEAFTSASLLAIISIAFIVLRDLSTRRLGNGLSAVFIAAITSAALTAAAGIASLGVDWQPIDLRIAMALIAAAGCLMVGYVFGVMSMTTGEVGFVQPFRYTSLLWGLLLGIVLFDERPDRWMLVGATIVIVTGIFAFYRERRVARMVTFAPDRRP